jgi:hypothetical protein
MELGERLIIITLWHNEVEWEVKVRGYDAK